MRLCSCCGCVVEKNGKDDSVAGLSGRVYCVDCFFAGKPWGGFDSKETTPPEEN